MEKKSYLVGEESFIELKLYEDLHQSMVMSVVQFARFLVTTAPPPSVRRHTYLHMPSGCQDRN